MRHWIPLFLALVSTWLVVEPAFAQVYVTPRRPGKSKVEYLHQDWQTADLLVGTEIAGQQAGGVQLYFYEEEREVALRAAASIEESYYYLVDAFDFVPPVRFPYMLYSSYQEYTRTNLFPIQEGVLGVTSPQSLEVTLPYFGDHRRFEEVSTHELAHEFTIQKVNAEAKAGKVWGDPISRLPLWFVEGLAEYYAHRGLDPETEMLVRDMVANPDLIELYGLPGFWDDFPGMGLWTYKAGQVRVAFLEETYGKGTIQRILEEAPSLVNDPRVKRFRDVVERVTGEDPLVIEEEYEAWLKRRAFPEWLAGTQDPSDLRLVEGLAGYIAALGGNEDGSLLLYRTIDPYTGRSRLFVTDPRDHPRSRKRVAIDGHPGTESLHPIDGRNFDAREGQMVYFAESRGHDVLHRVFYDAHREQLDKAPPWDADEDGPWYHTRIHLHDRQLVRLSEHGIVAATSPALSPDGTEVAFVGLSTRGVKDLYVLTLADRPRDASLRRLTDDAFAEREVAWGPQGIVYTSDATGHRKFNLFLVDPAGGAPERLTTEARDAVEPTITADGRLFFRSWRGTGHADLYEWTPEGVIRRTDLTAGLAQPTRGPDDSVWVLMHRSGGFRPALVPPRALLDLPADLQPNADTPRPYRTRSLDHATDYTAANPKNWRPDVILGYFGGGPGGVYGELYASASDRLRDHNLVIAGSVYGSFRRTDGFLSYMNQAGRWGVGAAAFHLLRPNLDRSLGEDFPGFTSEERFYGGMGSLRYPFGRFAYVQVDQAVGGVKYDLSPYSRDWLAQQGKLNEWESINGKARFQTETTLRLGYDTIRYHALTGPLSGDSVLFEAMGAFQPLEGEKWATFRLDAEHYIPLPLIEGANLGLRGGAGTSLAGRYGRTFLLYSFDTLRGVRINDPDWLLGRHFWFTKAELQVPLSFILRSPLFSTVEGIVGVDFGAVGDNYEELWDKRVLDLALGANIAFGPLVLRLHWARAFDIGAPVPEGKRWVPNISLSYLQL